MDSLRKFGSLASLAGSLAAQSNPSAPVQSAATAWIKAHAVPFTSAEAGSGFADLAALKTMIGKSRIVALGEPTHGTREAFQMKHRLLEYLVEEMGFSIFSIEANMPEAYALNDYVIDGKGDAKALIAGMYFWTWNTEEVLAMVEWMRAWNQKNPDKPRLQFTGFDMQTSTVAARLASEYLNRHAPDLAKDAGSAFEAVGKLRYPDQEDAGFTPATGSFPVDVAKGKKLVFSAWIRTEDVSGYAGIWWRCDRPSGMGAFDNMRSQAIRGTTDWKRYEFTLEVDADTIHINFGCLLSGSGTAWFDDLEVTLDGQRFVDPEFHWQDETTASVPLGPRPKRK